jgi:hypothetical protein
LGKPFENVIRKNIPLVNCGSAKPSTPFSRRNVIPEFLIAETLRRKNVTTVVHV